MGVGNILDAAAEAAVQITQVNRKYGERAVKLFEKGMAKRIKLNYLQEAFGLNLTDCTAYLYYNFSSTAKSGVGAILQIKGLTNAGAGEFASTVEATYELAGSIAQMSRVVLKNTLVKNILNVKISMFIGYIGEANITRKLLSGNTRFYLASYDHLPAMQINLEPIKGSMRAYQKTGSRNGIDLYFKIRHPHFPDDPDKFLYVYLEIKTTAYHGDNIPADAIVRIGMSAKQKKGEQYVKEQLEKMLKSYEDGPDAYKLGDKGYDDVYKQLEDLKAQLHGGETNSIGLVINQAVNEKFSNYFKGNTVTPDEMLNVSGWFKTDDLGTSLGHEIPQHFQFVTKAPDGG